jgi:predicted Zn-dependent peptidase
MNKEKSYLQIASGTPNFGSLNIFYNAGGKVEREGTRGISHLVEHLMCKSFKHLDELLDAHGIDSNASTSENYVHFYFNGLNEHLKKFEEELLQVLSYIPSREDFENEKKIVLAEYSDSFAQKSVLLLNILRKYFNAFSAIGFRKDIEEITYERYLEFQKEHFTNPSRIIRVGETDLGDFYSGLSYCENVSLEILEKDFGETFLECDRKTRKVTVGHWYYSDMNLYELEFVEQYMGVGLPSPLYQELREKLGLVYSVSFGDMPLGKKRFVWLSYDCENKDRKILQKALRNLIKNISANLSEERFNNVVQKMQTDVIKTNIFNFKPNYAMFRYEDCEYEKFFSEYTFEKFQESIARFSGEFLKSAKTAEQGKGIKL